MGTGHVENRGHGRRTEKARYTKIPGGISYTAETVNKFSVQFMKMDNLLHAPKGRRHFYTFISYLLLVGFWGQNFLYFHEEKPLKDQSV